MKPEFENIELIDNTAENRFELPFNGHIAFITYEQEGEVLALTHTIAPDELKGTGTAQALAEKVFAKVEASGKKIHPYCPYIFAYIRKHPEWKRLVDPAFSGYNGL